MKIAYPLWAVISLFLAIASQGLVINLSLAYQEKRVVSENPSWKIVIFSE